MTNTYFGNERQKEFIHRLIKCYSSIEKIRSICRRLTFGSKGDRVYARHCLKGLYKEVDYLTRRTKSLEKLLEIKND